MAKANKNSEDKTAFHYDHIVFPEYLTGGVSDDAVLWRKLPELAIGRDNDPSFKPMSAQNDR